MYNIYCTLYVVFTAAADDALDSVPAVGMELPCEVSSPLIRLEKSKRRSENRDRALSSSFFAVRSRKLERRQRSLQAWSSVARRASSGFRSPMHFCSCSEPVCPMENRELSPRPQASSARAKMSMMDDGRRGDITARSVLLPSLYQ